MGRSDENGSGQAKRLKAIDENFENWASNTRFSDLLFVNVTKPRAVACELLALLP